MLVDTKGDAYGRAMQHLSVGKISPINTELPRAVLTVKGVYLAELSLIGLMSARGAQGPALLMVLLLIITIVYQTYLNFTLTPLENILSDELMAKDEEEALTAARSQTGQAPIDTETPERVQPRAPLAPHDDSISSRLLAHRRKGGFFAPFLFNGSKSSYPQLRKQLWDEFPGQPAPKLDEKTIEHAFHHPSITAKVPKIWLARDDLGVSKEQVNASKKQGIDTTDEGASFNEKGEIVWDQDSVRQAPIFEDRIEY